MLARLFAAALVLVAALTPAAPAAAAAATPVRDRLDRVLQDERRRLGVPGAQAAIVRRGRPVWSGASGRLERGGRRVRAGDPFVLASVGKLLVATMVVRLSEEGRLSLDDSLERHVPGMPNGERITIAQLLAHRSGLREYSEDPAVVERLRDPRHPWTARRLRDAIVRVGAESEPGSTFAYRNTNYVLLGQVLERAGRASLEALTTRLLERPLGLRSLSWRPARRTAHGHEVRGGRLVDLARAAGRIPTDALGPVWGDGGIAGSARDVARIGDALFGGRLVGASSLRRMATTPDGYGLGVTEERDPFFGRLLGHDGAYGGYSSLVFTDMSTRTTIAVTANRFDERFPAAQIGRALLRALRARR